MTMTTTNDTASTPEDGPQAGPWLVWMWQHFALSAYGFATLRDAVAFAEDTEANGDGSLHAIEGPATEDDIAAAQKAYREGSDEQSKADSDAWRKRVWLVFLRAPRREGDTGYDWSLIYSAVERADADALAAQWVQALGAGRVKVERRKP